MAQADHLIPRKPAMNQQTRELPYPDIDINEVRRYLNGRANSSSVREMARRIGIGNTSLDKFLNGSEPYARNRAKICEWYLREHGVHPVKEEAGVDSEVPAPGPENHLDAILRDLRGEARNEARLKITSALAQGYRRMGLLEPVWLSSRD
jgi:hypothetical protein